MLVVENLPHRYAAVPVLQIADGMPGVVAVSATYRRHSCLAPYRLDVARHMVCNNLVDETVQDTILKRDSE